MNLGDVKPGLRVRTAEALGSTTGMLIVKDALDDRKEGVTGTVMGFVAGHGGDVWWIRHDNNGKVAPYSFTELDPSDVPEPERVGWDGSPIGLDDEDTG